MELQFNSFSPLFSFTATGLRSSWESPTHSLPKRCSIGRTSFALGKWADSVGTATSFCKPAVSLAVIRPPCFSYYDFSLLNSSFSFAHWRIQIWTVYIFSKLMSYAIVSDWFCQFPVLMSGMTAFI